MLCAGSVKNEQKCRNGSDALRRFRHKGLEMLLSLPCWWTCNGRRRWDSVASVGSGPLLRPAGFTLLILPGNTTGSAAIALPVIFNQM